MTSQTEENNVIILGAGQPHKGGGYSVLREASENSKVLDWLVQAYEKNRANFQFVGGYNFKEIKNQYLGFKYIENTSWKETGPTGSLFKADIPGDGDLFVTYSDILYRKEIIQRLKSEEGQVVTVVDRAWRNRYQGRSSDDLQKTEKVYLAGDRVTQLGTKIDSENADAEFIGLVKFDESILKKLQYASKEIPEKLLTKNLSDLLEWLRLKGTEIKAIDVQGDWAELDDPRDLKHFILGTKAETLERLKPMVTKSKIGEQVKFNVEEWRLNKEYCLKIIKQIFEDKKIVARSSSLSEDGFNESNAGNFESILNIDGSSEKDVIEAVDKVIKSYSDNGNKHQVLIQEMLTDVAISGVVFTRTLTYGAPYYVINYDAKSGSTESVTSGTGEDLETLIYHREASELPDKAPEELNSLIEAIGELESIIGHDSIDVEFIINSSGEVHILQTRPITVDHSQWPISDDDISKALKNANSHYNELQKKSPFVYGEKAIFGLMPDWNPAEIIGPKPRKLAFTLYAELVTDEIWATQRTEYGYRDVRPYKLLQSFAGQPFIDIRGSFNSFIPAQVSEELAEKLVDHYLNRLIEKPELHDKIEFDVVFTCMSFDFDRRKSQLKEAGFTENEIIELRDALIEVTNNGFQRIEKDLNKIKTLKTRYQKISDSDLPPLKKAFALLDDCKTFGTLPFAHLARAGFVAVTLLKSAVKSDIITNEQMASYMNSMNTVAKKYSMDQKKLVNSEISMDEFLEIYGHLRPGTYDITTPSYKNDIDQYFSHLDSESISDEKDTEPETFEWSADLKKQFSKALSDNGMISDFSEIEKFMRDAIEGREYAKFMFSKNLSDALDFISNYAASLGLEAEEIAHVRLSDLEAVSNGFINNPQEWLEKRIEQEKNEYILMQGIEFPPLLTSSQDLYTFIYPESEPNFVGNSSVTGELLNLEDVDKPTKSLLSGKIVLIQQADPGFDWLFGFPIGGLITEFGGANSHMAIRSAELGLPAAIGTGEEYYKRLRRANTVTLDCVNRKIEIQ